MEEKRENYFMLKIIFPSNLYTNKVITRRINMQTIICTNNFKLIEYIFFENV